MIMTKVLFPCSRDSCRTQMTEAILRDLAVIASTLSAPEAIQYRSNQKPSGRRDGTLKNPALAPDHKAAVRRVRDRLPQRIFEFV